MARPAGLTAPGKAIAHRDRPQLRKRGKVIAAHARRPVPGTLLAMNPRAPNQLNGHPGRRLAGVVSLILATLLGLGSPTGSAAPLFRCERPGQAPLFAAVPCNKGSGPGERLGDSVIQPPPARPLAPPPTAAARPDPEVQVEAQAEVQAEVQAEGSCRATAASSSVRGTLPGPLPRSAAATASCWQTSFAGVGTPCRRPKRTISPFR